MVDIHVKSQDVENEKLAEKATHLDDLTTFIGSHGQIVVCAQKNIDGTLRNVCWACTPSRPEDGLFHKGDPDRDGVEVQWGGTYIALHAACAAGRPRANRGRIRLGGRRPTQQDFQNITTGMQHRRSLARMDRQSAGIRDAAAEGKKTRGQIIP